MSRPRSAALPAADGRIIEADFQLSGGASALFDAVFVSLSEDGAKLLSTEAEAVAWVHDAFQHLKVIGSSMAGKALLDQAGVVPDAGVFVHQDDADYLTAVANGKIYDREPTLKTTF